ncbi:MAG: L,D-transpeptidase [Campylobacterales bacterium]
MNKKNLILTAVAAAIYLSGCADKQNIVVIPLEHNNSKATVELYENGVKKMTFKALLGRNGVAKIGKKQEGDGKTPSGKYPLTALFGNNNGNQKMPFIKTHPNLYCIDDSKSMSYNKIIDANKTVKDYDSFEYMLREDGQYDVGAVIDYNEKGEPMRGSCIFIHIQKSDTSPTAGCIALRKEDIVKLLNAIDKTKNPTVEIKER